MIINGVRCRAFAPAIGKVEIATIRPSAEVIRLHGSADDRNNIAKPNPSLSLLR